MSEVRGRFCSDRRLSVGSSGFASTLAMKMAATDVMVIPRARYVRRTCRHRRPRGSKKTGEVEAGFSGTTGIYFQQREDVFVAGHSFDVYNGARVDSQARGCRALEVGC